MSSGAESTEDDTTCDEVTERRGRQVDSAVAGTGAEEDLDVIDPPAVVSTSSDATVIASVCGWFVEDRDEPQAALPR